jgi:long-chain acyl-CoA synthetase
VTDDLVGHRKPVENLADLVAAAAVERPDGVAFVHEGSTTSWAEVDRAVDRAAGGLRALGLRTGDRVGLHLGNTLDFPVAYFGALRAGLVVVPLNPGYTEAELRHALGDSGARALITAPATAPAAAAVVGSLEALEHLVVTGAEPAPSGALTWDRVLSQGVAAPADQRPTGGEDLALVIYTSGTSGTPRGAMLPHRALLANLEQSAQISPPVVTGDDVVLLVLPLFHIYGLNTGLGAVAFHAATGVLCERFDPVETLQVVRREAVTSVLGAPPMYLAWSRLPDVADGLSSVRVAVSGAAPLPGPVLLRLEELTGRRVFEGYGLTETAPALTSTLRSPVAKPSSIGRPLPGVELRLVDEGGRPVEEGDPGEIVVRGANLFTGYWPAGADGPVDGWFATGDVGYLDSDGDLFLVDRRKELVLVSGFNVYPREVEDVLAAHPGVQEAAVLGVPDPSTGEAVRALVVLEPGAQASADDLVAHCARSLARFKCPTQVEFVAELPHSATGKVSKARLRERSA